MTGAAPRRDAYTEITDFRGHQISIPLSDYDHAPEEPPHLRRDGELDRAMQVEVALQDEIERYRNPVHTRTPRLYAGSIGGEQAANGTVVLTFAPDYDATAEPEEAEEEEDTELTWRRILNGK
ncbi:MAG: hypothetical protein SVW77_00170 [Candidatus Nanohaloarchaea archaeon]|nr:hypothetical protein [Candidatus Nanohaloarchaea archaeon]